jgi:uncharacterized protein YbaR (Trm112 family)
MPADSRDLPVFDPSVMDQLACPACHGALRVENSQLVCIACSRNYPIVDGTPALIAGREILQS